MLHGDAKLTQEQTVLPRNGSFAFFLRRKYRLWKITLVSLFLILLFLIVIASTVGYVFIPPSDIVTIILSHIPFVSEYTKSSLNPVDKAILMEIRVPRIIGAVLIGSALAASGCVLQVILSNPLADPYVTGVSSGSALGAALAIVLGLGGYLFGLNSVIFLAFLGGIISVGASFLVAGKNPDSATFLLSGVTITFLNSAGVAFLTVLAGDRLPGLVFWLMGGLDNITWGVLGSAAPIIILGLIGMLLFSKDLNSLLFGEEQAKTLGVDVQRAKITLMLLSTLVTATAVSISGIIGFVGLIIPHLLRLILGSDQRILLPSCILAGASFLLLSDTLARTIMLPIEIPVGVITASVGGPFFIYLLKRQKKVSM